MTPGIRGGGAQAAGKDDQERTMSPARGDRGRRELLVVGRPIIAAPDRAGPREEIADAVNGAVRR